MKKLLLLVVMTHLLIPCRTWAIMPFRSADEARAFFIKHTFKRTTHAMPPYDYDSGPIVPQKKRGIRTYNPEETSKLAAFVKQTTHTESTEDGTIIDGQLVPHEQLLSQTRKLIKQGADPAILSTLLALPCDELLSQVALRHKHLPLLQTCLKHGDRLDPDSFIDFNSLTPGIQQVLLAHCVDSVDKQGNNVLHSYGDHKPGNGYLFCRNGVDAAKKNLQGNTPLHTLMKNHTIINHIYMGMRNNQNLSFYELDLLQKVAALYWRGARLDSKNGDGKKPLDLLENRAALFAPKIKATAQATAQVKSEYERAQRETPILLQKHIATSLVPLVMGYVQPTWVHEIWPTIKENASRANRV